MDQKELKSILAMLARGGRYLMSFDELHDMFGEPRRQLSVALHRQVTAGVITRVFPGVFANPSAIAGGLITRGDVVRQVRPEDDLYVSLDSALHHHRSTISKPAVLTLMTTGRSLMCEFDGLGAVELVHTKRSPSKWADMLASERYEGLPLASFQLAVDDMLRTGRPLEAAPPSGQYGYGLAAA